MARILIAIGIAIAAGLAWFFVVRPHHAADREWRLYKQRFIAADGRVIDTGNGNISHSEGQGYAMVLAAAFHDQATFARVWMWTHATLRRPDGLFSWRYVPGADDPIPDRNNATDGDLVICWGLLRAAAVWNVPQYRDEALAIAATLAREDIVRDGTNAYLLPGTDGFVGPGKRVVNLSYWVFPALADIAKATGDPVWQQVIATGSRLILEARFGVHHLPPDWLETAGPLRPADGYPPRFGYDAVRVPLYLIWGDLGDKDHIGEIADFWSTTSARGVPAWVDLVSGAVSPEKQSPGMAAITRLTLRTAGLPQAPVEIQNVIDHDYYSASLLLLAKLAGTPSGRP